MLFDEFLISRCIFDQDEKVRGDELYAAYVDWVRQQDGPFGQLIPASRRRFSSFIIHRGTRYGIKYGPHRFDSGVSRGFKGISVRPNTHAARFIPTHIAIGFASQIAAVTGTTFRNWIEAGRVRGVIRETPRKTLVPLSEAYRLAGAPPERLDMAVTAAQLIAARGQLTQRDMLRAACLSPASEWQDRILVIIECLTADGDPGLGPAIQLLENML